MSQAIRQIAIIRKKHQAFTVGVQPSDREYPHIARYEL
jgi:hypothetical protein